MHYLQAELYQLIKDEDHVFDFLQTAALDGLWYWDLDNLEEEWMSDQFWHTLGYEPTEQAHTPEAWKNIIFPEDREVAWQGLQEHIANPGTEFDMVVRYRHKNGGTVWIRCRGLAIRGKDGRARRMLGAHIDVTEIKEKEQALERLKVEYETVFNGTQDAVFLVEVCGDEFRFIRNNRSHQEKTGLSIDQIRDRSPVDLLGPEAGGKVIENYRRCVLARTVVSYEENLVIGGIATWWSTVLTPVMRDGTVKYIVGSAIDITSRKELEDKLRHLALVDELTGLANRRGGIDMLDQKVAEARRYNFQFAVMFVDLDGFKEINDRFGHDKGDEVLILTAKRLNERIRESDFAARMGGDEFLVILDRVNSCADVERVGQDIRAALQQPIPCCDGQASVDASIGVSFFRHDVDSVDELLREADQAMYEVKKAGKGGLRTAMPSQSRQAPGSAGQSS